MTGEGPSSRNEGWARRAAVRVGLFVVDMFAAQAATASPESYAQYMEARNGLRDGLEGTPDGAEAAYGPVVPKHRVRGVEVRKFGAWLETVTAEDFRDSR